MLVLLDRFVKAMERIATALEKIAEKYNATGRH